ncbi:hypothetical protein BGW36DRAFT_431881 [Talaromyces proteolyticus]|uniref:Uncharacterized protein n=1 Tax=Talaromyces proteolyticus TaxID=1131652 RepID=A0AAD4KGG9_9EURO|nr:uncharacterized protein BGW36DRAFT_431881 [Talaromyces proteolyticus]KAH8691331.1 hypothetical protein BGW36DRAFT_431881 [Talaromyces proteolyticus]
MPEYTHFTQPDLGPAHSETSEKEYNLGGHQSCEPHKRKAWFLDAQPRHVVVQLALLTLFVVINLVLATSLYLRARQSVTHGSPKLSPMLSWESNVTYQDA